MTAENHTNQQSVAILDPLTKIKIQCAGPHFMKYLGRMQNGHHDESLSNASSTEVISDTKFDFEIDVNYLRSLDPKEWKDQDHYHVLGLKNMRFDATDDDIRRAYRKIVLKHHPDKRKAQGEEIRPDDDYFVCITKAYETLGNTQKRRSYDSIDPEFDDSLPTSSEIEKNFYGIFQKYFALNGRWSEKKNVPMIGNAKSTRQEVDTCYNFWYAFDSWREYSYLDEEDKDKGQDREERRWIEKQNKVIRLKRKKEEMSRIRALVDLAYNNDPRIVKFRNDDKEKKLAAKRAKMSVAQAARAEEERVLREAQALKEKAEQAEQKRIEQIRLEKEQQKRALKKERKLLRDTAKEQNYFSTSDKEKIRNMEGVEKICEMLKILELQTFNKELATGGRDAFLSQLKDTENKLEEERKALFDPKPIAPSSVGTVKSENSTVVAVDKNAMWNAENMQLLIKAVNLFPAGTVQRWEVIANYLNMHATNLGNKRFFSRDVLNKAKDLQSSDFTKNSLKSQANDDAFASFQKSKKELKIIDPTDISVNNEPPPLAAVSAKTPAAAPVITQNSSTHTETTNKSKSKSASNDSNKTPLSSSSASTTTSTSSKKKPGKGKQNGIDNSVNNNNENNSNNTNNTKNNNNKNDGGGNVNTLVNGKEEIKENGISTSETTTASTTTTPATNDSTPATQTSAKTWTKDEQALLEQAIKTYPITTADRWDRIAECIPNRTKKECLRRVKELVDRVNAKRDAQQIIK